MAATDQNYRNQRALDIVFAASSVLMLLSVLWMLVQDYNREFKNEQRRFRDVETALAQRLALEQLPSNEEINKAEKAVEAARKARTEKKKDGVSDEERLADNRARVQSKLPARDRAEATYQSIKADLASIRSFYDIGIEENMSPGFIQRQKDEIARLETRLIEAEKERDEVMAEIDPLRQENDRIEKPLIDALSALKKITDKFDAQAKIAADKRWGWGDRLRNLPILDGFAPPLKIHQFTINDVPIDYNFAYTTRFDRCMTCHQGIDRPAYTPEALAALTFVTTDQRQSLLNAREMLKQRKTTLAGLPEARHVPDPSELRLTRLSKEYLTPSKIKEFCAHPRLELFVGGNSKHPAERFGCTSCHAGQGSATSFSLASHAPDSFPEEQRWKKEHGWESNHYWDFPMLPMRFVESSCLKCHHEVTDLISSNNRPEAPKLLQGFNTIKEFGCFGCHEINGRKKGRPVGPDLRLEPTPPLDQLTAAERARIEADPDTAPGNLRKVGPSLYRISEKTNKEWLAKWLRAPREFRPDTKMPHFYGLSNNDPSVLPDDQKKFPAAEIQSIAYYLFKKSDGYLKEVAERHQDTSELVRKERERIEFLQGKERLDDTERQELEKLRARMRQRETPLLVDLAPNHKGDTSRGRILFSERGCLACHSHDATMTPVGKKTAKESYVPAIASEAQFGPNLSQLRDKLGIKANDPASSRNWLVQWLLDPHVYSPRSRMPVTHLTPAEAADIAAWLIAQPAKDMGDGWKSLEVKEPGLDTLDKLAKVYLVRLLSASNADKLERRISLPDFVIKELPVEERELLTSLDKIAKLDKSNADQARAAESATQDSLKMYLGRKAIFRLGCFACHDIPGYESAKPIGTELNEWGKKDPTKLAFENIKNFVDAHFHVVDKRLDAKGSPVGPEGGKAPMERFFYNALVHQQREGFLYQKLQDPRSYDYQRERAWDDRSRMPQFRFARTRPMKGETPVAYAARADYEEAKAREAVMTFVLGLVAEPIPMKSINQPSGDRLAEVKGRQVLDKFNCAGCHLVRPGYFEFKTGEEVTQNLEGLWKDLQKTDGWKADHVFPEHRNWVGAYPATRDKLSALGIQPRLSEDTENPALSFRLTHALRFQGTDNDWHDIRALFQVSPPTHSIIYPPREALASPETLKAFMKNHGPYGGTFADLLVRYLISKKDYPKNELDDSADARIEVPPSLLGQGERTQTDWLYQFLLNPTQVRRMTVLRMPRFNMSKEEAKILVSYFAAGEKINNPGIGLHYPYEAIAQQEPLDTPYWKAKTAEYVARLKQSKPTDPKAKEASLYEVRINELQPIWQQVMKDSQDKETAAKARLDAVKPLVKEAEEAEKKAKDALDKAKLKDKDGKEQATKDLEEVHKRSFAALDRVKQDEFFWTNELKTAENLVAASRLDVQRKTWEEKEAYVTDAFRLVANTQLCVKCHQLGDVRPGEGVKEGPPLSHVYNRLRPGWTRRWISDPVRLHDTVMPVNFPAGAAPEFQQYFAGSALDQATAARDMLLMYPRAVAMPANQYWLRPLVGEKKSNSGEKK